MTPTIILTVVVATGFVAVLTKIGHDSYPSFITFKKGAMSQSSLKLDMTPTSIGAGSLETHPVAVLTKIGHDSYTCKGKGLITICSRSPH